MGCLTLRDYVKQVLLEDLKNFKKQTKGIDYEYYNGEYDTTFDKNTGSGDNLVQLKSDAKNLKRIWRQNADHQFFASLNKVHWFSAGGDGPVTAREFKDTLYKLQRLLGMSRKNEISAMLYKPGEKLDSSGWGRLGVLIEGYVTLAHNNMDELMTGYGNTVRANIAKKYQNSGVPKRAMIANEFTLAGYILDAKSFHRSRRLDVSANEGIVDNWKPVGLVTSQKNFLDWLTPESIQMLIDSGLPMYDDKLNALVV
jgi:hypothetical protein